MNCQVNGVSHDASKEVNVAHFLEKRILQLYPSLATSLPVEEVLTASKLTMNDKFHLINVCFQSSCLTMPLEVKIPAITPSSSWFGNHNSGLWQILVLMRDG